MSLVVVAVVVAFLGWQLSVASWSVDTRRASSSASVSRGVGSFDDLAVRAVGGPGDAPIAPPPDAFDGPAEPEVAPPPQINRFAGVTPQGGTWAVVIGVNDYPGGGHDLRSAVADANDMGEALQRMGVASDRILVLRDRQASARNIRMSLDWLNAHAGPDAVGVFFYAGHVRKVSSGREAMVGADGNLVTDLELAGKLDGLRANRAWIAMAACYGGGFTEALKPGRVLTGAAPANKLAYENSSFGRSYMVQYMVRKAMIENLAPETVQSSFSWAREAISRDYPGREPVQIDRGTSPLDLRPPGVAVPSRPAAAPAPSGGGGTSGGGSGGGGGTPAPTPAPTTPPTTTCFTGPLGVRVCR